MNTEFAFVPVEKDMIRVDAAVGCGQRFEGIALIHDPYLFRPDGSLVAKLQLQKPLGFGAVTRIINTWTELAGTKHK